MISKKLEEFVCENVQRTANPKTIKRIAETLAHICELTPTELGHFLYIFASAERSHKFSTSPANHFKNLLCMLKRIKFELDCAICF